MQLMPGDLGAESLKVRQEAVNIDHQTSKDSCFTEDPSVASWIHDVTAVSLSHVRAT